ncbi:IS110 family transposase [Caloranaerobacter azorensis]|uniref:IS110 family transposase n=1 Tax=Caloranaerobacter azorensis TaxID=116090 RepID=UPI0023F18121|nr:IS110 family transposase [Caloranaerobacter azorensis]
MNYTQNKKLLQITESTLIIGIDIAKHTHVARAQDFRGIELGKYIKFDNSIEGFEKLLVWTNSLCIKHNKDKIIVGVEPTGHYWFTLSQFLRKNGIKLVLVNPMHVKKSKELDDNSPTKNDIKDARVIAQLVKDGRYSEPIIPEGIYAELRNAMDIKYDLDKKINSTKAKIIRWIDRFFPEFFEVFSSIDGKTALLTLEKFALPSEIVKLGEEKILSIWKEEVKKAVGIKRAMHLVEVAKKSVGLTQGLDMAKYEIELLIVEYRFYMSRLEDLMFKIESILDKIPYAKNMLDIKGVGIMTVAGFISEVGDLNNYSHSRQIIKLAGLNLKENSSGKHKGKTTITKRGRAKLRSVLFKCIMPLVAKNNEFKFLHHYYTTRNINPLKKKQSLIALCCKLIRIFFVIAKKGVAYDSYKFLSDIKHPISSNNVA